MDRLIKKHLMLCICFVVLLAGCDQTAVVNDPLPEPTSVPPQLRTISTTELQANVTVDGNTTAYYGRDYPTGNWTIDLRLVVGQEYNILIEWLVSDVLVLEQSAKIVGQATDSPVLPEYTSISSGAGRFDSDCDGQSNLEESIASTDPLIAEDPQQDGCNTVPDPVVDPDELLTAFVAQDLPRFDSRGITTRVKRFVIPMRVQTLPQDIDVAFGVSLFSTGGAKRMFIEFFRSAADNTKYARMLDSTTESLVVEDAGVTGSCDVANNLCALEYNWKEQHWYNLVLEEDANTSTIWRGYIVDSETGVETLVATSQTEPDIIWIEPDIGQAFRRSFTASQCAIGLPALTVHFQDALVNDTVLLGAPRGTNLMSGCVRVGAGASTDITYEDGKPVYVITLGQ